MDLFFADPETSGGLGLNQVRYNIGGSDARAGDAHYLRAGGFVQTYEPTKGTYDWGADATQRRVLQAAKARGVQFAQAFSNSPPYWMTVPRRSPPSPDIVIFRTLGRKIPAIHE